MIPVISPRSVTSSDPTFASTISFTASNTDASASIWRTSWPFSSRICDTWVMSPPEPRGLHKQDHCCGFVFTEYSGLGGCGSGLCHDASAWIQGAEPEVQPRDDDETRADP